MFPRFTDRTIWTLGLEISAGSTADTMEMAPQPGRYNNYFVPEDDIKYLPPYMRDVPETPDSVQCPTKGSWPEWLHGSFMR